MTADIAGMNVLFLAYEIPYPPNDGCRIRTFNILKQIAARHAVTLVAFGNGDSEDHALRGIHPYCVRAVSVPRPAGPHRSAWRKLADVPRQEPISLKQLWSDEMAAVLRRLCTGAEFDVVHIDQIYLSQYWHVLAPVPLVQTHHNVEAEGQRRALSSRPDRHRPRWWATWLEFRRWRRYEVSVSRRMAALIAVSERDAEYFEDRAPSVKAFVVPNGVDTAYFCPASDPVNSATLLYTGSMDYQPNVDAVLWFCAEIWPGIREARPDATFFIVGRDPVPQVQDLARVPGVTVTGAVADVRPDFAQAAVYVMPLRLGSGTRLKALEAMAMRTPIVSTQLGVEGLQVMHERELLIANDTTRFTQQVLRLLSDRKLRLALGDRARQMVENCYDWDHIGEAQDAALRYAAQSRVR